MIAGIGVDAVRIDRLQTSLARPAFVQKVFGPQERALLENTAPSRRAERAAGCWAAKEAFLKAAGRGIGGFALAEIQVLRRPSGAPYYQLSGGAQAWAEENRLLLHLSISHDGGMAIAFAVAETV